MAHSRTILPPPRPLAALLTARMAGVGLNFAVEPDPSGNIEDTLIHASEAGMLDGDLRVLGVLTAWFGQHHDYVNADRMVRVVRAHPSDRVRAYWAALALWRNRDRRFARLAAAHDGEPIDLLPVGTAFQIQRRGADERFLDSPLRVPLGTLRTRPDDVLSVEALARLHHGYCNRVLMGPSWRADVWTLLERNPDLSVADAARGAYCGFATAWAVIRDFRIFAEAGADLRVA